MSGGGGGGGGCASRARGVVCWVGGGVPPSYALRTPSPLPSHPPPSPPPPPLACSQEAERYKSEDEAARKKVEAKNGLENYAYR